MLNPIEIRSGGGRLFIGPRTVVPSHPHAASTPMAAIDRIFHEPEALIQLRRQWPELGLAGERDQHLTDSDLRQAVERGIAHHRINLLWVPPVSHAPMTIPAEFQPKQPPAAAPEVAGVPPRPAVQAPVDRMNPVERVGIAFEQALGYLRDDRSEGTAELRKAIGALTDREKTVLIGSLALLATPARDDVIIGYCCFRLGLDGARAATNLLAACAEAAKAKSKAELEAAARRLANAFQHLGETILGWLARGQLETSRGRPSASEPREFIEARAPEPAIVREAATFPGGGGGGATPTGFGAMLAKALSAIVNFVTGGGKAPGDALKDAVAGVNPGGGVDNCGFIIDAAIARLRETDPDAAAPLTQDGSFPEIEQRLNTKLGWDSSFSDAFDAVKNGGDGTIAVVGIAYSGGTAAHVVVLANDGGVVGIVEGQNWGPGNPPEVITDVARANERYNPDGGSNIGWGLVP